MLSSVVELDLMHTNILCVGVCLFAVNMNVCILVIIFYSKCMEWTCTESFFVPSSMLPHIRKMIDDF